jgi:ribosome biogenesis GTPase / thiamine phosphate phosphatase
LTQTSHPSHPYDPLAAFGWNDRWLALFNSTGDIAAAGTQPGRVVRHDGSAVLTAMPDGTRHLPVRSSVTALAVGDWVTVERGAVTAVLPRASLLQRADPDSGTEQLLAANVDLVLIVCGLDRPIKAGRIQRCVALAWDAGATPAVVLTKLDLVDDATASIEQAVAADPTLDVLAVSARSGRGMDDLARLTPGRTVVLLGESGAGKSTLVNSLCGSPVAAIRSVREGDAKGRHTTTARQLHLLPAGGCLIDTPGLRAVGLWVDSDSVDEVFDDVVGLAGDCRFRDCTHTVEPGCAVEAAVERGELPRQRLDSWRRLHREAVAAELRADVAARHRFERRFGRVAREAQRMKRR